MASVGELQVIENTKYVNFTLKAKFHYAILISDKSEAGSRPAASWNFAHHALSSSLACSELAGLRQVCNQTSLGPVCDQNSVMEFSLDQLRTGVRPGSNRFELSRRRDCDIAPTCSNQTTAGLSDKQ